MNFLGQSNHQNEIKMKSTTIQIHNKWLNWNSIQKCLCKWSQGTDGFIAEFYKIVNSTYSQSFFNYSSKQNKILPVDMSKEKIGGS